MGSVLTLFLLGYDLVPTNENIDKKKSNQFRFTPLDILHLKNPAPVSRRGCLRRFDFLKHVAYCRTWKRGFGRGCFHHFLYCHIRRTPMVSSRVWCTINKTHA